MNFSTVHATSDCPDHFPHDTTNDRALLSLSPDELRSRGACRAGDILHAAGRAGRSHGGL